MNAVAERRQTLDPFTEVTHRPELTSPRVLESRTLQGLVLGHDPEFAQFIADLLGTRSSVRMTTSLQIALGLLGSRRYDVVVIEYASTAPLPLTALLRHVRGGHPDAVIVVTTQTPLLNRQVVECFDADADDYLAAPFHPGEFDARVQRLLRRSAEQARRNGRETASHDGTCIERSLPAAAHLRHSR